MFNVLDLFSGIGGFSLGLERTGGFRTVAFCEIEPFCQRVLRKHWPDVPIYDDVRELTDERLAADGIAPDIITGGFPCQDLSVAGLRAGIEGERSGLWSELHRLIRDVRPRYAIVENVTNLLAGPSERRGGWFGRVLGDLAEIGYDAEWRCISAADIGAPFLGDRVWIVAAPYPGDGESRLGCLADGSWPLLTDDYRQRARADKPLWLAAASGLVGSADGFSDFLDRRERTEGLGNAVVPQIPELIGRAILNAERMNP